MDALGLASQRQGHYAEAARYHHQSLGLFRALGHRIGEAQALTNLGELAFRQEHAEEATSHYRHALDICREIGHPSGAAAALSGLTSVREATDGQAPCPDD
jgi:tetratricopeptide (TPR) repeat protein